FARAEAARVLGEVGRKQTIAVLDKAFRNDRDGLVQREAAVAIKKLMARFPSDDSDAG
ncbi:MAG TPA: HEAT repeat domain-containing protein, partial [Acidobacteria bacterium]|nr:HEAT repeat domain-containing protein [Acidobacteriota bacterium]